MEVTCGLLQELFVVQQPPDAGEQLLLDRAVRLFSGNRLCEEAANRRRRKRTLEPQVHNKSELERRDPHLGTL